MVELFHIFLWGLDKDDVNLERKKMKQTKHIHMYIIDNMYIFR